MWSLLILACLIAIMAFAYMWLLENVRRQEREMVELRTRRDAWLVEPDDEWSDAVIIEEDEA